MEQAVDTFLKYLQYEKRASLHTLTSYKSDLAQFNAYLTNNFPGVTVLAASATMVRAWMMYLLDNEKTTRTINRKISTLRAFFRYQVKQKTISINPMEAVVAPRASKRLPQFVAENDMEKLFHENLFADTYEGHRDQLIIELFYVTGMRLSELISLRRTSIDLYNNTLRVIGKRNKERIIPFSQRVKILLQNYLQLFDEKYPELPENYYIFVGQNQNKIYPKAVYRIVRKYLDLITTIDKRSPHVLRHTFATHLLNHGADINAIKTILGHSSLAATQIYTHNSIEKLKNIYNQAHPRA